MSAVRHTVNAALRRTTGYILTKRPPQHPKAGPPGQARARKGAEGSRPRGKKKEGRPRSGPRGQIMAPNLASAELRELEGLPLDQLNLTEIANRAGTDKGTIGPSAGWPAHNYTDVYEAYLSDLRYKPINVLEIGLGVPGDFWDARIAHGRNEGGGASLRMWHDYFPEARIYGADINAAPHLDNDRIRTFVLDQGDPDAIREFLDSLDGVEFDVIIDDGSHRPDHQQVSLGCLFPRLRSGGIYIIEDLLPNGLGDNRSSRSSSDTVRNTRRVLKHFRRHGRFEDPHAIVDPEYVAAHVEFVNFHVPRRWAPNNEAVTVLKKR